ncbi:MAG: hypothetical protein AAGF48_12830 [Pseudomonadota bacterium]
MDNKETGAKRSDVRAILNMEDRLLAVEDHVKTLNWCVRNGMPHQEGLELLGRHTEDAVRDCIKEYHDLAASIL